MCVCVGVRVCVNERESESVCIRVEIFRALLRDMTWFMCVRECVRVCACVRGSVCVRAENIFFFKGRARECVYV